MHNTNTAPRTLKLGSRQLIHTGTGRRQGSVLYLDPVLNETYELFFVSITSTGPAFSIGVVLGNSTLGKLRIDHHSVNGTDRVGIGDLLLVGPLGFLGNGHVIAQHGWLMNGGNGARCINQNGHSRGTGNGHYRQNHPANERRFGYISHVAERGTFGRIIDSATGLDYFVHANQLRGGMILLEGRACTFTAGTNERGRIAYEVRPAA
jgi:cold shock CspA family protein